MQRLKIRQKNTPNKIVILIIIAMKKINSHSSAILEIQLPVNYTCGIDN